MAGLFLVVAVATNVLSNNACAVLFTPIAVNLAGAVGVAPSVMAITVLLAANCSFATPIGYQTNLLVMGPGRYRFADFLRGRSKEPPSELPSLMRLSYAGICLQ